MTCHAVVKGAPHNRGTPDYGVITRDSDVVIGQANCSQELSQRSQRMIRWYNKTYEHLDSIVRDYGEVIEML